MATRRCGKVLNDGRGDPVYFLIKKRKEKKRKRFVKPEKCFDAKLAAKPSGDASPCSEGSTDFTSLPLRRPRLEAW